MRNEDFNIAQPFICGLVIDPLSLHTLAKPEGSISSNEELKNRARDMPEELAIKHYLFP